MSTSRFAAFALAVTGIAGLAACGGSGNGEVNKSADQIVSDAQAALRGTRTVHIVASNIQSGGQVLALDLRIASGRGASGCIAAQGVAVSLVTTGGKAYLRGRSFFQKVAGNDAAQIFDDSWVAVPDSSSASRSFKAFTDPAQLSNLIFKSHGGLKKGGTGTIDGQDVVLVTDTADSSRLYVATNGPAYPVRVVKGPSSLTARAGCGGTGASSSDTGVLEFTEYGSQVSITPPPGVVDFSKLGGFQGSASVSESATSASPSNGSSSATSAATSSTP